MDQGILIGRAQLDYHLTAKKNHHLMLTAGILEDMFSGYGIEYLFLKIKQITLLGLKLFMSSREIMNGDSALKIMKI